MIVGNPGRTLQRPVLADLCLMGPPPGGRERKLSSDFQGAWVGKNLIPTSEEFAEVIPRSL
jgi:hypothetical protein